MGHVSQRAKHSRTRAAARTVLVLGIVAFAGAVLNFALNAYVSTDCFTPSAQYDSGAPGRRDAIDSDECRQIILRRDEHQRVDAAIAILAIMVVIGGAVRVSKASRRTRKVILVAEVAVVVVGVVYIVLLTSAFR